MLKKYKDLIECANAITDEDILDTDWLMPSDIDPFLNALFRCIYDYRHPRKKTEKEMKTSEENVKSIADQIVSIWGVWEDLK